MNPALRALLFLFISISQTAFSQSHKTHPHPTPLSYKLYSLCLDSLYKDTTTGLVIKIESNENEKGHLREFYQFLYSDTSKLNISPSRRPDILDTSGIHLFKLFYERDRSSQYFTNNFTHPARIYLEPDSLLMSMLYHTGPEAFKKLFQRHPNPQAKTLIFLSKVIFNETNTRAMFFFEDLKDGYSMYDYIFLFRLTEGKWVLSHRLDNIILNHARVH